MEDSPCEFEQTAAKEMEYLKRQAERPYLERHALPTYPAFCTLLEASEALEHIKVGSFYVLDHSKLSSRTPDQLKFIRVVMVSEKGGLKVSVRYPSINSLRTHFSDGNCGEPVGKKIPSLDEKFIMGSELAGDALYKRIPAQEIAEKGNSWSFWVVPAMEAEGNSGPALRTRLRNAASKKGFCCSELKLTGMVHWGKRRQVRFLGRQQKVETLSRNVRDEEEGKGKEKLECEEDEGEEKIEEVDGETVKVKLCGTKKLKRNCQGSSRAQRPKRAKLENENQNQIQVYSKSKREKLKNSIERWSVERYKLAEENMLKILKAKGAIFGNPILRPALRLEARKLIGDTGLLDHLLKHMAGKVAPGGMERFRRRHNAEGAMEYWLESADLANIRKEAGVQDPYWNPPPGWNPGDNPSQDPLCAGQLRELKEEMAKMKKDMQELVSKKQEENLAIVTHPSSSVTSLNWDREGSLIPLKEVYIELVNRKTKIEEQLMEISQSLSGMEEQMGMLKSTMEEPIMSESEAPPQPLLIGSPTPSETERETKEVEQKNKPDEEQEHDKEGDKAAAATAIENKAAKIERLKSGFRICRPQGTFLWPNMIMSPQSLDQLEDLLVVPTPTSASSTTLSPHIFPPPQPQLGPHPASPVKPFAERRPISNAILNSVTKPSPSPPPPPETPQSQITTTTTKSSLINLNELPNTQISDTSFFGTITYQRRHHPVTINAAMPCLPEAKKENEQHLHKGSSASSSNSSLLPFGERWWLALASSSPSLDKSNRGY